MTLQMLNTNVTAGLDVRLAHLDHDVAIGTGNDLYVVIWRDRTTHEGIHAIAQTFSDYARNRAREIALITIIEQNAKMPSSECRTELAQTLAATSPYVLISAVAFEGSGFVAAGIRSVVIGLTMLARQEFPHRVFSTVALAADWIEAEHLSSRKTFKSCELQSQVTSLRRLVMHYAQP